MINNIQNHCQSGSPSGHHRQTASNCMDSPGIGPMQHPRQVFQPHGKTTLHTDFEECCPKEDRQPLPSERPPGQACFSSRESGTSSASPSEMAKRLEMLIPILDYLRKNRTIPRLIARRDLVLISLRRLWKEWPSTQGTIPGNLKHIRQLTSSALLYVWLTIKIRYQKTMEKGRRLLKKELQCQK